MNFLEDHPVASVLILALSVRLAVIALTLLLPNNYFASDDSTYMELAGGMIDGTKTGWTDQSWQLYDSAFSFVGPLTAIFWLVGISEVAGQVYVAIVGAATAALATQLAMYYLPRPWALVPGGIIALLPSQVIWSSLVLKDASVWMILTIMAVAITVWLRASRLSSILIGAIGIGALLFALGHLRDHTLVVAAWAFAIATIFGCASYPKPKIALAITITSLVPLIVGAGVAGWATVTNAGSLEQRRLLNAEGARTGFIGPPEVSEEPNENSKESASPDGASGSQDPTESHGGESPGTEMPASDPVLETLKQDGTTDTSGTLEADIKHLPQGLLVMLAEPYPLPWEGSTTLRMARLEALVWYPVILLALFGVYFSRREAKRLLFPLVTGLGSLTVYALTEGNIGTAYRHRGEFVWVVALFAGLGAWHLFGRAGQKSGRNESRQ